MIYALGAKYGDLGRIVKDEKYYEPPEVDTSKYDKNTDPHGLEFEVLKERVKDRQKLISAMQNNRTSCYNFIMSKLSRESKDEIKRDPDYVTFYEENDPLKLWMSLKKLHLTTTLSKSNEVLLKQSADNYKNCYMGEFETLSEFRERFDLRLTAYKEYGGKVEDKAAAMDYLYALCKTRYAEFQAHKLNQINEDSARYAPADPNKVHVEAMTWVSVVANPSRGGKATCMTGDALLRTPKKRTPKHNTQQRQPNQNASVAEPTTTPTRAINPTKTEINGVSDLASQKGQRDKSKDECYNCGKLGQHAYNAKLHGMTMSNNDSLPNWYEIVLDNGSHTNIVNPRFLSNLRPSAEPATFTGVAGKGTITTMEGELEGFFYMSSMRGMCRVRHITGRRRRPISTYLLSR